MSDALTVSNLINSVKQLLEGEYAFVSVLGEVSNLSRSSAGHIYFTLSDKDSGLSAVMFKGDALRNPAIKTLKDGDKIICHGGVSVYAKRGTFQLVARRFEVAGAGDLKAQFEKLKRELATQGLFDPEQKKAIPTFPKRVAVITAEGGAALQDFINVYSRRALGGELVLIPALVQGQHSSASLRKALASAIEYSIKNKDKAFDVIVLTRGGGSMEDLWSFNDEGLAWDIFNCPIPVISAVGHQVDYSISDFVADLRSETPTAAAEQLTQKQTELASQLKRISAELQHIGSKFLNENQRRLSLASPSAMIGIFKDRVNQYQRRLRECRMDDRISRLIGIQERQLRLDDAARKMERMLDNSLQNYGHRIERNGKMLNALDPRNVLGRGYVYVSDINSHIVATKSQWNKLENQQKVKLHFKDGTVDVKREK